MVKVYTRGETNQLATVLTKWLFDLFLTLFSIQIPLYHKVKIWQDFIHNHTQGSASINYFLFWLFLYSRTQALCLKTTSFVHQ